MRWPTFIVLVVISLVSISQAQLTKYINEIPACGLQCIETALQDSICSLTNTTCICTNPDFNAASGACILSSCSVIDQLTMKRISELGCGVPTKTYQPLLKRITHSFSAIATIFLLLRIYTKMFIVRSFAIDDWIMIVTGLINIAYWAVAIRIFDMGFGANIWDIPTNRLSNIFKLFVVGETLYIIILTLTKISILIFLLSIFPSRHFRIVTWTLIIVSGIFGTLIAFLTVFGCTPVSYSWTKWSGTTTGTCRDSNAQTFAAGIINIIQDAIILVLPLPELYKLNISLKKKIQLFAMFGVGIFVSFVSVIRLQSLISFANSTNPTYDNAPATYWSSLEPNVSMICACMPALRYLLSHLFPRVFKTTVKDSNSTPANPANPSSWQSRSRTDKRKDPENVHHDFYELTDRTEVAKSDSSLSDHGDLTSRANIISTPESQQKIIGIDKIRSVDHV